MLVVSQCNIARLSMLCITMLVLVLALMTNIAVAADAKDMCPAGSTPDGSGKCSCRIESRNGCSESKKTTLECKGGFWQVTATCDSGHTCVDAAGPFKSMADCKPSSKLRLTKRCAKKAPKA